MRLGVRQGTAAILALGVAAWLATAAAQAPPAFVAVVLGAGGGPGQDDLSAYLLAPAGSADFVGLDAGTLLSGIRLAWARGSFGDLRPPADATLGPEGWILRTRVKAYLVSHAHLDHVAGLVVDSPEDERKPIMGLATTVDRIRDHLFNWKLWPNFGDEGERPLAKYRYVRLPTARESPIAGTAMSVEAFPLSHGGDLSTAFLIRAGGAAVLYVGDTGPDAVEGGGRLGALWTRVAPLARDRALRAIFLEVSYPEGRPDHLLFGHLTPSWMLHELRALATRVDPQTPTRALRDLTVVVTHVKPALEGSLAPRDRIAAELASLNDLGLRLVLARQGQRIEL
jgi:3',5'-cyclic-nucleotide phosphodiesterase